MRLTLRTMLAWRAGLLPADEAADIEQQILRGKAARFLLERVDAFSIRPPRVAMTWLSAGGLTESDVTEYLCNRLREHRLLAFEKACLESEILLAHVVWRHKVMVESRRAGPAGIGPRPGNEGGEDQPSNPDERTGVAAAFERSLLESLESLSAVKGGGPDRPPPLPNGHAGPRPVRPESDSDPPIAEPGDVVGAEIGTAIENYLRRRRMDWWWTTAARAVVFVGAFFILTGATFGDWLSIVFAIVVFTLLGLGLYLHSLTTDLPKDLKILAQFFGDVERLYTRVSRRVRRG